MILLAVLVIVCVSFLFLVIPLVRNTKNNMVAPPMVGKLNDLHRREEEALEEVKTLMADHGLGIISDDEYEKKLQSGRFNVAILIQEREKIEKTLSDLEKNIESEVLNLRITWGTVDQVVLCTFCFCRIDSKALLCPKCFTFREDSRCGDDGTSGEVE